MIGDFERDLAAAYDAMLEDSAPGGFAVGEGGHLVAHVRPALVLGEPLTFLGTLRRPGLPWGAKRMVQFYFLTDLETGKALSILDTMSRHWKDCTRDDLGDYGSVEIWHDSWLRKMGYAHCAWLVPAIVGKPEFNEIVIGDKVVHPYRVGLFSELGMELFLESIVERNAQTLLRLH